MFLTEVSQRILYLQLRVHQHPHIHRPVLIQLRAVMVFFRASVPEPLLQLQSFRPVVIGEGDNIDPGQTEFRKPVVDGRL